MARRQHLDPRQIPLITPDSAWTPPVDLPDLSRLERFALDTEEKDDGLAAKKGPGWAIRAGHVAGVSVAWRQDGAVRSLYAPLRHPDTDCLDMERVVRWLTSITRRPRVVMHNGPYDVGWMLTDLGVPIPPHIDDTTCEAVMCDENQQSYRLDDMCRRLGIPGKDESLLREAASAYGIAQKDVKKSIHLLPARYAGPYAEQDAVATLLADEMLQPEIDRQKIRPAYQLEMDLIPLVTEMRRRGIRLDMDHLERSRDELLARRDRVLTELTRRVGGRAVTIEDIRSQTWLIQAFKSNDVPHAVDERGTATFGRDWMRQGYVGYYEPGRVGHWLPQLIAEAKQCHEAASKFIQGYLLDFAHGGRVHANINQFRSSDEAEGEGNSGTRSHRVSYDNPPLQQIPSRPEKFLEEWTLTADIARLMRSAFLPEEREIWGALDYSQQEFRYGVHYAVLLGCDRADEAAEMYRRDPKTDFHNVVVDLTGLARRHAKDVNFAKAFGAGVPKFADMTGMPLADAEDRMSQYDTKMPFVKQAGQRLDKLAQQRGWIKLIDGARCHFDNWEPAWLDKDERARGWAEGHRMGPCGREEAETRQQIEDHPWRGKRLKRNGTHKAFNRATQGSSARQTKLAMRQCGRDGIVPLIQMHDEMGFSFARTAEGRQRADRAAEIMRDVVTLEVPVLVDSEFGTCWGDAKHAWDEVVTTTKRRKKHG